MDENGSRLPQWEIEIARQPGNALRVTGNCCRPTSAEERRSDGHIERLKVQLLIKAGPTLHFDLIGLSAEQFPFVPTSDT